MKRILLVLGVAVALAGCGGGGGGHTSTPTVPGNPGNPGGPGGGGGGGTPTPTPTPISSATNAPATVVVAATSSPFAIVKTAVNPASASSTDGKITVTGQGMTAGAALYATVTDSDKSGGTCLQLIPQGQTSGTGCQSSVGVTHSGDQVAVQYNNGPTPPTGSFNITVAANGGTGPVNPFAMNYPAPAVGQNTSGTINPWGGGVVYANGNIYFTVNSATSPLGATTYANGTAGASVSYITALPALTNAPAGGLIIGPDNNLWGTEQNASKAFSMSPSGATHEFSISCPSGSSADNLQHTGLLGPQTGITTDGTNIYVLCADVAHTADGGNNTVNTITTSGNVTSCSLKSGGRTPAGPFANGATFSGGNILTEEEATGAAGSGAGGAASGVWISIPATNCGQYTEFANSAITGSGNVWLLGGSLYSETDNLTASPAFAGATVASPKFNIFTGGGGLAQDTVLGSGFFVGTADNHDAQILTKWTGGSMITIDANSVVTPTTPWFLPLSAGGSPMTAGTCEVAFNSGGGMGIVQLPDGKFAWPVATDGLETGRNYLCFLNP
ncbi:MAG: hypothetical protein ACRENA_00850 [Vulcanimicrobiaceae bacterium]